MTVLGVGVIGCGEATQALHLPALTYLAGTFRVTALCDASRAVVDAVGERWNVAARGCDLEAVLERDDVDVVLVASPHVVHPDAVLGAVAAGKHVLVEKPLCLSIPGARAIADAAAASDVVVQVGYMRRYARAFDEARTALADIGPIRFARIRAVLGRNAFVLSRAHHVLRGDDVPRDVIAQASAREAAQVAESLGSDDPAARAAYLFLLTLNSHDLSALRALVGAPTGVRYAARRGSDDSPFFTAALDHGPFVCHLETGFDEIPRVDTDLQVYGDDRVLRLRYDSPFVRTLPTRLEVTRRRDDGAFDEDVRTYWEDPYVREWSALHQAVTTGTPTRTPADDAVADLELARDLVAALDLPAPR